MGRGRAPCCEKTGLNKGAWTAVEDMKLVAHIRKHGHDNWRALPKQAGLLRCGKSCRLRWTNYLCPDIRRGNFTKEEEDRIFELHGLLGNKWSQIASRLPGRTDNEIKNVWNTHLKKRLPPKAKDDKTEEPAGSPSISVVTEQRDGPASVANPSKISVSTPSSDAVVLKDPMEEIPDISIEPKIWSMIEDDCEFDAGDAGRGESENWLADLERELELSDQDVVEGGDPVTSYFQVSHPLDDLLN